MNKKEKQIPHKLTKLKIELPSMPSQETPGILEEIRWQDDGGNVSNPIPLSIYEYDLPLQTGDLFRVVKGDLISENDKYYYIAEIEIISSAQ
ncbi:MAG: hypothetical protein HUJ22_07100 [Gracilimonas sp.]|uniref:hypothetical protein n=1 Tax=Gracilimonas sp. TaxID=1974203 RepID=UPI00198CDBC6|nr:hypothetical protein [Gracilimonas sp.]MBD3616323.1 hypothetical protein [Gracilimonas sp.]